MDAEYRARQLARDRRQLINASDLPWTRQTPAHLIDPFKHGAFGNMYA
jgi:hypothetical protein